MNCIKCGNKLPQEAKFCQNCGQGIEPITTAENIKKLDKRWIKKILTALGSIAIFILAFAGTRFLTDKGTKAVVDEINQKQTEKRIVDYFTDTSGWKEFNSAVGGFRATFPSYPNQETDSLQIPGIESPVKYNSYSSETQNGTFYMVMVSKYPPEVDTSNPDKNLEGALNGIINSREGNQLVSSNMTYLTGNRALDFVISNGDITVQGKAVIKGQNIYEIMVAYENGNLNLEDYNKFMSSFVLQ